MGLQFTWIKENLFDFFLADVRNSKGKFDEIKRKFWINLAPIASPLSLNTGDHEELKILLQIRLIASRINKKLKRKEGTHHLFKGEFGPKIRAI